MNTARLDAPMFTLESREQTMVVSSPVVHSDSTMLQPLSPQFRYEDRRSTLIIESDRPLSPTYLQRLFTLQDVPEEVSSNDADAGTSGSTQLVKNSLDLSQPPRTPSLRSGQGRTSHRASRLLSSPKITTPPAITPPSRSPRPRQRILFYDKNDPHYGFTNFSNHPVMYKGKKYPTSEHLFQSFKFQAYKPGLAEHIRTCSERPSVAFSEARRFQPEVRPDWKDVNISMMDIALEHKFTQHEELKKELLDTGDAELVEDSDKDSFWGVGVVGNGRNELGKALERLRDALRRNTIA